MTAMRERNAFQKPIICLGIMLLCLLTGMDDISGCWQPMNFGVAMIQSAGTQDDDGGDHSIKAIHNLVVWKDAIHVARQPAFSQAYSEEIKWQVSAIYLSSSLNRAPPSFS